jgi:hypothetical protein
MTMLSGPIRRIPSRNKTEVFLQKLSVKHVFFARDIAGGKIGFPAQGIFPGIIARFKTHSLVSVDGTAFHFRKSK